jgi:hypothetical protein
MKWKVLALAVGLAAVSELVAAQAPKQLQIYASVVDGTGSPAKSVEIGDVQLKEGGAEARITKVEPVNWPVKLQILLDNGIGMGTQNVQQLKNGVAGLLEALPPDLEVTLVSTAPQPRILARATTDRAAVQKGLDLLAGDSGAGRFVESLNEATQRIERDKTDHFPLIVSVATTVGDRDTRDSDVDRIMKRLEERPIMVHVVVLVSGASTSGGGASQTNIGLAVTKFTGGRFENINSPTRIATLLPEIGKQAATAIERQSHLFRITADRPAGASGAFGQITVGTRSPLSVVGLSFDGRMRDAGR